MITGEKRNGNEYTIEFSTEPFNVFRKDFEKRMVESFGLLGIPDIEAISLNLQERYTAKINNLFDKILDIGYAEFPIKRFYRTVDFAAYSNTQIYGACNNYFQEIIIYVGNIIDVSHGLHTENYIMSIIVTVIIHELFHYHQYGLEHSISNHIRIDNRTRIRNEEQARFKTTEFIIKHYDEINEICNINDEVLVIPEFKIANLIMDKYPSLKMSYDKALFSQEFLFLVKRLGLGSRYRSSFDIRYRKASDVVLYSQFLMGLYINKRSPDECVISLRDMKLHIINAKTIVLTYKVLGLSDGEIIIKEHDKFMRFADFAEIFHSRGLYNVKRENLYMSSNSLDTSIHITVK